MNWKFRKKEKKELTEYEKLSKAIADGILMAMGIVCIFVGVGFLTWILVMGGFYAYGEYQEKKMCEEEMCPVIAIVQE